MKNIKMIITEFEKVGSKWIEKNNNVEFINQEFYNNTIGAKKFFTNLGGYERHEKSYTSRGYIVTKINSISPNKTEKIVRQFEF